MRKKIEVHTSRELEEVCELAVGAALNNTEDETTMVVKYSKEEYVLVSGITDRVIKFIRGYVGRHLIQVNGIADADLLRRQIEG